MNDRMICNELYDDARRKEFMYSFEDVVEYCPLTIKNARETYVKCRIDAGGGTLEVKLPSKEIIRAERLDDDRIDQLLQEFTPRKNYWQAFEGSSAKLIELFPGSDNEIAVFPVEFFREDDLDANPSAFDHDGNIWIYAECWRDHYSLQNIVLKLPEYEELRLRRGQRLSARLLGDPQRRRGRRAAFYFPNGV